MTDMAVFLLAVLLIVLVALVGLALVRRAVPRDRLARHTDVTGYVYAVIGVIYAVMLAQVVVAAWEQYRDARAEVANEASAVLNLSRMAEGWPDADRAAVEDALVRYARQVVDVEWPAMARGDFRPTTDNLVVSQLWQAVSDADQAAISASASYQAAFVQLDALDEARRNRLLLGEDGLPASMTLTLIVGAIVTVGFTYLFVVDDGWVHGLITASLTVLIAVLLLLQYQLEMPFQGATAIDPTAMELVLQEIDPAANIPVRDS
jgi:hypothetical protein